MADILMYAPMGNNIPKERIGGAETGARRSVEMLRTAGITVDIVEKPTMWYGFKRFIVDFVHATGQINSYMKKNKNGIFYLVGFYERQIVFEAFLCLLAKINGFRVIYEPKNGSMVRSYINGNYVYQGLCDYIFANADIVFCQGVEYKKFLNDKGYNNAIYHPNYISMKNLDLYNRKECRDEYNFVFVGRVSEDKNIGFAVDVFAMIHKRYSKSKLYIIGGWNDEYKCVLDKKIFEAGISEVVEFTGRLSFDGIAEKLNQAHFFLFPSKNAMEGHSNALTEAMAFGVVPIASDYGFNRSIIGIDELVHDTFDESIYAKSALDVIENGTWEEYSKIVRDHVLENFTEITVQNKYLSAIQELLVKKGRLKL